MDRLEMVRNEVDKVIFDMPDDFERRCAYLHLYGVAQACSMIAVKRGLNPEIAAISGMLHDIYSYRTGIRKFHSHSSAEEARPLLRDMNIFSPDEQKIILSAIFHHGDKIHIHDDYDEILKDADSLQKYFYNTSFPIDADEAPRLKNILEEFGIQAELNVNDEIAAGVKKDRVNRCEIMADIAEALAGKPVNGERSDMEFVNIVKYWPDNDIYSVLRNAWCAAFVYHCAMRAGIILPIRHPNTSCRFAGVNAWYQWANLPDVDFYHRDVPEFTPQKGDIVIYDNIIPMENKLSGSLPRDHIGIVLSCSGSELTVAEGNMNNQNQSAIVSRKRFKNIDGYVRISHDYQYDGWKYDYKTGEIKIVPYPI